MPLQWHDYDAFDWAGARQSPMLEDQRAAVTELAADLVELSAVERDSSWGSASPRDGSRPP